MTKTRPKKASKAKKEPETAGPEATILEYLEKQYRPYSTNDIIQNLHGEVGKTAAVKAIEALSSEGKIVAKMFGKVMVSAANKIEVSEKDSNIDYHKRLRDSAEELAKAEGELANMQEELKEIKQYPDDNTLGKTIDILVFEIATLDKKISAASSKPSLSPQAVKKVLQITEDLNKESEKRMKMYKSFLKYLSEFIDPKVLIDDLGLEDPGRN